MFLKIYKYEFKNLFKIMAITVGVSLGMAIISGLLLRFLNVDEAVYVGETPPITAMFTFLLGGAIRFLSSAVIPIIFTVQIILILVRFYKAVCSDEALLTFTLPVEPKVQYASRVLVAFTYALIGAVTLILSELILGLLSTGSFDAIKQIVEALHSGLDVIPVLTAIEGIVLVVCMAVSMLLELILAVLIGNKLTNRFKIGAVIGFVVLFYYGQEIISVLLAVVFMTVLASLPPAANPFIFVDLALLFFIICAVAIGVLSWIFGNRLIKKMNV